MEFMPTQRFDPNGASGCIFIRTLYISALPNRAMDKFSGQTLVWLLFATLKMG